MENLTNKVAECPTLSLDSESYDHKIFPKVRNFTLSRSKVCIFGTKVLGTKVFGTKVLGAEVL